MSPNRCSASVTVESLTDPKGTSVLEQNFQFDLVSTEKLLQKYIDRPIAVEQVRSQGTESFGGTLLSLHYYVVDSAICLLFGLIGFRTKRAAQMVGQYRWINQPNGRLRWRRTAP